MTSSYPDFLSLNGKKETYEDILYNKKTFQLKANHLLASGCMGSKVNKFEVVHVVSYHVLLVEG